MMVRRTVFGSATGIWLFAIVAMTQGQEPPGAAAAENKELIAAALKLTKEAAGKYEFALEDGAAAPRLVEEPVLRWSNPASGEVHGNVFLWTSGGRPAVVGSIFKWFSPHTHVSHEFHSLAAQPLTGKFDGQDVWVCDEPGVRFSALAGAPIPARDKSQRRLQMREMAMACAATKRERDDSASELRLLPQPIFRYEAPQAGAIDGALFVFVQGTDPDLFLLLEARESGGKTAWQFAACRMNSVGLRLRYKDREIWKMDVMPWADVNGHRQSYTSFTHKIQQ